MIDSERYIKTKLKIDRRYTKNTIRYGEINRWSKETTTFLLENPRESLLYILLYLRQKMKNISSKEDKMHCPTYISIQKLCASCIRYEILKLWTWISYIQYINRRMHAEWMSAVTWLTRINNRYISNTLVLKNSFLSNEFIRENCKPVI